MTNQHGIEQARGFSSVESFRTDGLVPRSSVEEDEVIDIMTIAHHEEVATEPNTRREDDSPFSIGPDEAHFGSQPEVASLQSLVSFDVHRGESTFDGLDHDDAFASATGHGYRLGGESYSHLPDSDHASVGDRTDTPVNTSLNPDEPTLFAGVVPPQFDDGIDDAEHSIEWIGDCIKEIGTRRFFDGCRVDGQEFRAYDHAEIRSRDVADARPAVARIMAIYEQHGRKKVALEWFLRFSDVQKHIEYMRSIELHAPTPPPGATGTPPPSQPSQSLSQSSYVPLSGGLSSSGSFGNLEAAALRSSDDQALVKRKRGRPPKKRHQNMEDTTEYMQRRGLCELYTTSHPTVQEISAAVLYRKCEVIFAVSPTDPEIPARLRAEGSPSFYWYKKALDLKTCALTSCKPRGLKPKNYSDALEKRYRNSDKRSYSAASSAALIDPMQVDVNVSEDDPKRGRSELDGEFPFELKPKVEPSSTHHEDDISIDDPEGIIDTFAGPLASHYRPVPVRPSAVTSQSLYPGARADYIYPLLLQKMTSIEDIVQKSVAAMQSYLDETRDELRRGVREVQKFANSSSAMLADALRPGSDALDIPVLMELGPSPPGSPVAPLSPVAPVVTASVAPAIDPVPIMPMIQMATGPSQFVSAPPKKRKTSTEKALAAHGRANAVKPKEGIQPLSSTWQAPSLSLATAVSSSGAPSVGSTSKSKKNKKSMSGDEPASKKQKTAAAASSQAAASSMTLQFSSPLASYASSSEHSQSPRVSMPPSEESNSSVPGNSEAPVLVPLSPPPPVHHHVVHKQSKKKRHAAPVAPNAVVSDYGTRSKKPRHYM